MMYSYQDIFLIEFSNVESIIILYTAIGNITGINYLCRKSTIVYCDVNKN